MRQRTFLFFIPVATGVMAAVFMPLSLTVGLALWMLTMLVAMGLAFWALHYGTTEPARREQVQGNAPEAAGSAWAAVGRWLARH